MSLAFLESQDQLWIKAVTQVRFILETAPSHRDFAPCAVYYLWSVSPRSHQRTHDIGWGHSESSPD